jgi:hypothetical protein
MSVQQGRTIALDGAQGTRYAGIQREWVRTTFLLLRARENPKGCLNYDKLGFQGGFERSFHGPVTCSFKIILKGE